MKQKFETRMQWSGRMATTIGLTSFTLLIYGSILFSLITQSNNGYWIEIGTTTLIITLGIFTLSYWAYDEKSRKQLKEAKE